jgi:hypothetical protein
MNHRLAMNPTSEEQRLLPATAASDPKSARMGNEGAGRPPRAPPANVQRRFIARVQHRLVRSGQLFGIALTAAVAVGCLAAPGAASAHWHGGVWIGPGPYWWGPPYYPYYPYDPPAVVVTQPSPVVQVPAPPMYWYYCRQSNAYYPYVADCASGWEQVSPQPPAPAPAPEAAPR